MSIQITHIRLSAGPRNHERITHFKWVSIESGKVGTTDKAAMVAWVDDNGKAFVGSGPTRVAIGVVRPDGRDPYVRTYADKTWTNNLLELPEF